MTPTYQPRRAPVHEVRRIRGLATHLTRWQGTDPGLIVLLHGFMDTGDTFQFVVDALPDRYGFVAPDLRGFGRTGWPVDGYWFPDYFADLDALLEELAPHGPVTLVGHSMGGNIAMIYAGLRPERVAGVVNIEGFGLSPTQAAQAPERLRQWLRQLREPQEASTFPSLEVLAQLLQRRNPRLPAERARFVARAWTVDAGGAAVRLRFDPAHKRVNPVLYRRDETEACWRGVSAPLLYVLGAESEFAARLEGLAHPEAMSRIVATLEPCWIADAGHMVHHERPDPLAEAIEQFLLRHGLPL